MANMLSLSERDLNLDALYKTGFTVFPLEERISSIRETTVYPILSLMCACWGSDKSLLGDMLNGRVVIG